jgi:hypothetical protein
VDLLRFVLEPESLDATSDQLSFHLNNEDYHYMGRVSKRQSTVNFDKTLLIENKKEIDFISEINNDVQDESIESLVVSKEKKDVKNTSSFLKKSMEEQNTGGIGFALSLSPLIGNKSSVKENLDKKEMTEFLSISNIHTMSGKAIDLKSMENFKSLNEIEKEDGLMDILKDRKKRRFLKLHAAKQHCVENILFYEAVKQFENQVSAQKRIHFAHQMILTFLNEQSNLGINTTKHLKDQVIKKYEEGKIENECDVLLFSPIMKDLLRNTLTDIFNRFLTTALYKEMLVKAKKKTTFLSSLSDPLESDLGVEISKTDVENQMTHELFLKTNLE